VYDYKKKVHLINKTARELLSIKPKEDFTSSLVKRRFSTLTQPVSRQNAAYDTNHLHLYQHGGNELVLFRKELPCSIEGKEYVLSAFIDITPLENERKYEAASNTAKSDFLAQMSHEIRTPMNGIIGMAEAMSKESLSDKQKEFISIISRSADLLLNIINDILDYSKIEAGKMLIEDVPYRLHEEVMLAADLFRPVAEEKNIIIEIVIDKNVPDNIIGDPFRLRQVLSNLISNAVKFTHDGKILISVKVEEEYSGNITLQFSVADTGVGIPKDRLGTIFNSFTQAEMSTSRKYGGSGLGTTICKQLVTLMHGEIWAESPSGLSINKKNPGSVFYFTIEAFSNSRIEKLVNFSNIQLYKNVSSLVITHNAAAKKRLFSFLGHLGIKTTVLQFGENILHDIEDKLNDKHSRFHIIFIIDELGFDGLFLARKLYDDKISEHYKIIILSSNHKPENYIQSKRTGVDYYLTEPFEHKLLATYLKECFPAVEQEITEGITLPEDLSILVAEDNIINQKVAQSIFGNLGYTIDIASDGSEAIDLVKNKAFDIIFMDLEMPEKDGFDATREIRGLGYQMPIVAMTASAGEASKNNSFNSGMNEYITKPVKSETVQAILEKWFG
jgi:signal transduction histidine kinase/CheY-like chemotaxis protein